MNKLTHGATRLLVLALGLGLASTGWAATLVAEWGPGDFPVSAAGSAAVTDDDGGSGLTISKNNAANISTANGISINGYPATLIPGSGTTVKTVVVGYKVKSATTAGTIVGFGVDSNSANIRQNLNILSDGKLCFGWASTYNWGESNSAQLNTNQPNDGEVHFVTFAYAGNTTSGTTFWFDGANKVNKSNLGAGTFTRIGDITLGGVRGPANCFSDGGIEFVYVAAYNDVLSDAEAESTFKTARAAVYAASVTPVVDESNNAVFTVTDDASCFVDSAATYNSITFEVSAGKTLKLFGNTLTGTSGITVNGGTVRLISANTQLSGALAGTGTVAYPAGTLPSGVTYSATWTGTIWVKGLQGNQARNFDSYGQGTSKVKISGITGYLDSNPTITFSRELVLDDDTYGFALKLGNGNSPGNTESSANRCAIFKKLSGDGTLTAGGSTGGNGAYSWSVVKVIDSSDFTGTINCQIESGAQLGGVIFCQENEEMPDTLYNMFVSNPKRIFVSAGRTVANGSAVTVPAGKTWVAQGGIDVRGDLIVNGTLNATIVNNTGSITVNPGATVPTQGSKRDFTGWIVADGASISITQTAAEYGKGVTTVTGVENVSSITVLDPYGEVAGTITPATSATLNTAVKTAGKACWCDYEMDYVSGNTSKTGFENTGSDTTGLSADSGITGDNAFYNGMLYTYAHPWRNIAYPSDGNWTAVVRCTVPAYENAAVITFGTKDGGLIGLVAGANPETQMRLVQTTGNSHFVTNATMTVQNATTAQHVYIFSVENNQTVKVYCDGDQVLNKTFDSQFIIGGGIQVGSVHGGIGNTGIIRFAKDESPAKDLSETVQKDARIDCVRLYDYSLSAEQIAALSVEFPAVKLYRATVANGVTTTWGELAWTSAWDGGNAYSKIILTAEGDATLALTNSITAEEFKIDVVSGHVLTLDQGSGVTLNLTNPLEVDNGSIAFSGTDIKLGSTVNIGGTGTVKLGNGMLINEALSGAAKVEIASGDTVAVVSGGSIANPLTGAGTLSYQYTTVPASALSFSGWTGSVALPGCTPAGQNFNDYGVSGSKVVLAGAWTGWIAADVTFNPELVLNADLTVDDMSSYGYTFAKVSGTGTLGFGTKNYHPTSITITEVATNFTGSITNGTTATLTITTLARPAGQATTAGTKLLSTSSKVVANALTIGGAASSIIPVFDTDGLYVKAASVTKNDTTTYYDTVSAATTALGSDAGTLTLLMSTDSAITLAPGQSLINGNLASGGVTGPNGYELVDNGGTYTLVDNTASTWADAEDHKWNTATNWSTGYIPSQYTAVTFPESESAHVVGLSLNNASSESARHHCESMTLNGDVTFQRANAGTWAYVQIYGNVSGSGTLTFLQTGLRVPTNGSATISCPVVCNAESNDNFFSGSSSGNETFTFSGAVDIVDGELKADYAHLVFNGPVTIRNDGYVKSSGNSTASATFNGGIIVPAGAAASLTVVNNGGAHTIASTVTLGVGATLTIPNSTVTNDATFVASAQGYHVVSTVSGAATMYSVEPIPSSVEIGAATFAYGVDFTNATVTVAVTETNASGVEYTLTVGGKDYTASAVGGTTVTFNNVEIPRGAAYGPVSYNITSTASATTGTTSGSAAVADVIAAGWINENATTHGLAEAGGAWTNAEAVSYSEGKAAISDNRFAATTASTASRVVLEFEVCFSSTSADDVSGEAQAAIKLGEDDGVTTFKVLTTGNAWTSVSNAELTPDASETYKVVLTIDYGNNAYGVTVGNCVMTNSTGAATFPLATSKAHVQNIDFVGSGTLTSMKGDQLEGYMVKDALNHFYATIEAATQAYNSANGPYTVLHDGTAPSGWKIDNATKKLIKIAKGLFFMAY